MRVNTVAGCSVYGLAWLQHAHVFIPKPDSRPSDAYETRFDVSSLTMPCRAPTALAFVTSALDLNYISIEDGAVNLSMTVPLKHAKLSSVSAAAITPVSSTLLRTAVVGGHPSQLFVFDIAINWAHRSSLVSSFVACSPVDSTVISASIDPLSRSVVTLALSGGSIKQHVLKDKALSHGESVLFDSEAVLSPSGALACAISGPNVIVVNLWVANYSAPYRTERSLHYRITLKRKDITLSKSTPSQFKSKRPRGDGDVRILSISLNDACVATSDGAVHPIVSDADQIGAYIEIGLFIHYLLVHSAII